MWVANFIVRPKKEATVRVCETLAGTRSLSISFVENEKKIWHTIFWVIYTVHCDTIKIK